jgi:hypothetical protein
MYVCMHVYLHVLYVQWYLVHRDQLLAVSMISPF